MCSWLCWLNHDVSSWGRDGCLSSLLPALRQTSRQVVDQHIDAVRDVTIAGQHSINAQGGRLIPLEDRHHLLPCQERRGNEIGLTGHPQPLGGGLQMLVAGVVRNISTESAERAALGAGATEGAQGLTRLEIRAPITGVIVDRKITVGEVMQAEFRSA
mgnify:CR=1 FL=1